MVDVGWLKLRFVTADTLPQLKAALAIGTCAVGVDFYDSFYDVDPTTGRLVIKKGAKKVGGHDMIGTGYDPVRDVVRLRTSWGNAWWCLASEVDAQTSTDGDGCGYAEIAANDLVTLKYDADCAVRN